MSRKHRWKETYKQKKSRAQQHIRETTQQKLRRHKIMFCCLVHWFDRCYCWSCRPPTTTNRCLVEISCIRKVMYNKWISTIPTENSYLLCSHSLSLCLLLPTTTISELCWRCMCKRIYADVMHRTEHIISLQPNHQRKFYESLHRFFFFIPFVFAFAHGIPLSFCSVYYLFSRQSLRSGRPSTPVASTRAHLLSMLVCAFAIFCAILNVRDERQLYPYT